MTNFLTILCFLCFLTTISSQTREDFKFLPEMHLSREYHKAGTCVDIDGNYAVVGSKFEINDTTSTIITACAYIFYFDGTSWIQQARLTPSDSLSRQEFISSVAIDGENVVLGTIPASISPSTEGSVYIFTKPTTGWISSSETARLTASDALSGDGFGVSVAIDDQYVVAGSYYNSGGALNSGSAYIFKESVNGWVSSNEVAKLTASDADVNDRFGRSVDISGDNVIVGAYGNDDGGNLSGSAYIFTKPQGGWASATETAKLLSSDIDTDDRFGYSVGVSENSAVVGAFLNENTNSNKGSVYVYTKPLGGWQSTTETAKLVAGDTAYVAGFGIDVSVQDSTVVVGADNATDDSNGYETGAAYVFEKPLSGWVDTTQTAKLTTTDLEDKAQLGSSIAIADGFILVGAPLDNNSHFRDGSVYVYDRPSFSSWQNNTENDKLIPVPEFFTASMSQFGCALDVEGDYAVIGAHDYEKRGVAFLWHFDGQNWIQQAKLTASDSEFFDGFGFSVSIENNTIAVGAPFKTYNGQSSGVVYIFEKPVTGWMDNIETAQLTVSNPIHNMRFGTSVEISDDAVVVSAPSDSVNGYESGSAYVYTKMIGGWVDAVEDARLTASNGFNGDRFGYSLDIENDIIAAGAYRFDSPLTNSGTVYLYKKPLGGWTNSIETIQLSDFNSEEYDAFGYAVVLSGEFLLVGAPGTDYGNHLNVGDVHLFERTNNAPLQYVEKCVLSPSSVQDNLGFGISADMDSVNIVIGSTFTPNTLGSFFSGSAYFFKKGIAGWVNSYEHTMLVPSDSSAYDHLGYDIALNTGRVLTGAQYVHGNSFESGAAYVFDSICTSPVDVSLSSFGLTIQANNTSADAYQWLLCSDYDSVIIGATGNSYTALEDGYYAVRITEGDCSFKSECIFITGTDIKNNSIARIKIHPNPSNGIFTISNLNIDAELRLYTLDGKILWTRRVSKTVNEVELNLPAGVYVLSVLENGNNYKKRIIIHN